MSTASDTRPTARPGTGSSVIALVDFGAGNLRSVEFALEGLGVAHRRARGPEGLRGVSGILLPGVGAAESAVEELGRRGFLDPLRSAEVPLLGICLGMQLLAERSDEGTGEVRCLERVPGHVRRLAGDVRLPHAGWGKVRTSDDRLFRGVGEEEYFYFLHSFRVVCGEAHVTARARHGERFPAAVRRGRAAGVQFHPEKSGVAGLRVLANFCRECGAVPRRGPASAVTGRGHHGGRRSHEVRSGEGC